MFLISNFLMKIIGRKTVDPIIVGIIVGERLHTLHDSKAFINLIAACVSIVLRDRDVAAPIDVALINSVLHRVDDGVLLKRDIHSASTAIFFRFHNTDGISLGKAPTMHWKEVIFWLQSCSGN